MVGSLESGVPYLNTCAGASARDCREKHPMEVERKLLVNDTNREYRAAFYKRMDRAVERAPGNKSWQKAWCVWLP